MNTRHVIGAAILLGCALSVTAWAQSSPQTPSQQQSDRAVVDDTGAAALRDADPASAEPDATDAPMHADTTNQYPSAFHYDDPNPRNHVAAAPECDDATYNQAQVHGSIGVGVVAGNRVSGNYQSGVVNVTKNLGSCEDPTGVVSISVGVSKGNFNGPRRWRH